MKIEYALFVIQGYNCAISPNDARVILDTIVKVGSHNFFVLIERLIGDHFSENDWQWMLKMMKSELSCNPRQISAFLNRIVFVLSAERRLGLLLCFASLPSLDYSIVPLIIQLCRLFDQSTNMKMLDAIWKCLAKAADLAADSLARLLCFLYTNSRDSTSIEHFITSYSQQLKLWIFMYAAQTDHSYR